MLVGYARVSSAGQSLDIQREQLTAAGCERIFEEKKSGRSAENRTALKEALRFAREGDTLIVTRLDRLARSIMDLRTMVDDLTARGVGLKALQQGEFTTATSMGKALIGFLGVMAEFENDLRRERQAEGIAKAKAEGRHMGRPQTVDADAVRAALEAGERPAAIARRLGIGRASVYRVRDSAVP
jgi:DNA invertase Pin-like site-specific DNA recombinase